MDTVPGGNCSKSGKFDRYSVAIGPIIYIFSKSIENSGPGGLVGYIVKSLRNSVSLE